MNVSTASIPLNRKLNMSAGDSRTDTFLRIPPFPGARVAALEAIAGSETELSSMERDRLVDLLRDQKVGGRFWGDRPPLPPTYILADKADLAKLPPASVQDLPVVEWPDRGCDPWHMLGGARALIVEEVDERCAVAAVLNVPVFLYDPRTGACNSADKSARTELERLLSLRSYRNPFDGNDLTIENAIRLCGFWRALIDANRDLAGGLGFAFWKQANVAPLFWDGNRSFRFTQSVSDLDGQGPVAIWKAKVSGPALDELTKSGRPLIEVEDGFLRSNGLGADCIPPLSLVVDRLGAYFDPSRPSELEQILQNGHFDEEVLDRAKALRTLILETGLGKYDRSNEVCDRPGGTRRHILVPGQVEDDRSVREGGGGLVSNFELLRRVRATEPNAYILYKPHPDVLAGHRAGHIDEKAALEVADEVVTDRPIAPLLSMVDTVHVNTSLTGFEALLREKPVTTHGVPFYAGWGLTTDRGNVPTRRTAKRSIDELVAATLLLYPRYLDPLTGLPCPAEVVVDRLSGGRVPTPGMIVRLRRFQGMLTRQLRKLAG